MAALFLALCLCGAAKTASAQTLSLHVIWNSDQTTNPWTQTASSAGAVGGQCTLHLSFECPSGFEGANVTSLKVHEVAAHYPDPDLTAGVVPSTASPLCDAGNDPTHGWWYVDAPWASPGMHNGSHTISATVQYSWMTYMNGQPSGGTATVTSTITVDVENLLITSTTPTNPHPILWDPDAMTTVMLSANIQATYKAADPVTLKIYTTNQFLVKTYTGNFVIGPGSAPVSFTWDGSSDNTSLYPAGWNFMPKSPYLFQWSVGVQSSSGDYDQDKSAYLAFGNPADSLAVVATDASGETFQFGQTLTDSYGLNPSACQLDVYQVWDLQDNVTQAMPAVLGASSVTLKVKATTSPSGGDLAMKNGFCFLVSDTDGDMVHDRGHRNRVLLQLNERPVSHSVLTWGGTYGLATSPWGGERMGMHPTSPVANAADALAAQLNYGLLPVRGENSYEEATDINTSSTPRPDQLIHTGMWLPITNPGGKRATIWCPNGAIAQAADVAILCGHGAPDNFLFGLGNDPLELINATTSGDNPRNVYDVADSTANLVTIDELNSGPCFFGLDGAKAGSWATAGLVVWLACDTGNNGRNATGPSLPEQTVEHMGANCSMGVLGTWSVDDATKFVNALAKQQMQGQNGAATAVDGVIRAVKEAKCGRFFNKHWSKFASLWYLSYIPLPTN